jgi:hypothetical protein
MSLLPTQLRKWSFHVLVVCVLVACVPLARCARPAPAPAPAQSPFPGTLPGADISSGLPGGFEPSGAAWHLRLQQLFVIDDSGTLASLAPNGALLNSWTIGGDLEGVCIADPDSPMVYIARENPDAILEFDIEAGVVKRTFDLTATLTGPDDRGMEALTFVRNASQPEGGRFYAGLQNDGRVYVFRLPIITSQTSTSATFLGTLNTGSGLFFL